jgi:hypothetical protein
MIANPDDVEAAAQALARGAAVGQEIDDSYALTTHPDVDVVRRVNMTMGRRADRVNCLTTTRALMPRLFDWSRLPSGLEPGLVLALIERLFGLGLFGFRAPAAAHIPDHLVTWDAGVRTTLVIAAGRACPANALNARAVELLGVEYLHMTAVTRRDRLPDCIVLRHTAEDLAHIDYPPRGSTSTTIVGFHRLDGHDGAGRPMLPVEQDGSLPVSALRPIVADFGFGLKLLPNRQAARHWSKVSDGLRAVPPAHPPAQHATDEDSRVLASLPRHINPGALWRCARSLKVKGARRQGGQSR